jgi:hypothetical protein
LTVGGKPRLSPRPRALPVAPTDARPRPPRSHQNGDAPRLSGTGASGSRRCFKNLRLAIFATGCSFCTSHSPIAKNKRAIPSAHERGPSRRSKPINASLSTSFFHWIVCETHSRGSRLVPFRTPSSKVGVCSK